MLQAVEKKDLREILLAEKLRLEERLSNIAERDPKNETNWEPKLPQMSDDKELNSTTQEESTDEAEELDPIIEAEETLEAHYKDVIRALSKIDEESYGICEVCGQSIPYERLRANPAARTDIEHAG